jgi:diphthine synthase
LTLSLIGLGIQGTDSIPIGALEFARKCDHLYADVYTSPWPDGLLARVGKLVDRELAPATRTLLEDGRRILEESSKGETAVLCMGDSLIATTHMTLRLRALEMGIPVKVFYASGILNAVFGETGLHPYKLGRVITLVRSTPSALGSVYSAVKETLGLGLHALLLLEYSYDENFDLRPADGLKMLSEVESSYKLGVFPDDRLLIVVSRLGWPDQSVVAGRLHDLQMMELGPPPHSILIPGGLHYTESEALVALAKADPAMLASSKTTLVPPSKTIVDRTVAKTKAALKVARELAAQPSMPDLRSVFDNVEAYLSDADRFILEGKPELALVEAGYAEGLLDSLRLQGILKMTW